MKHISLPNVEFATVTAAGEMIQRALEFKTKRTGLHQFITNDVSRNLDLTPIFSPPVTLPLSRFVARPLSHLTFLMILVV
jgi:hypothetical protein